MNKKLKIIITGGTFDKEYKETTGELYFKKTHVHEMLRLGRSTLPTAITSLMLIDSLDMKQSHRLKILRACQKAPEDRVVITHGTDTMPVTAKFLGTKIKNKTIVLTGAMVPYKFGSSDGLFNLGAALIAAQTLPHGVYIVMNGRIFSSNNVWKDTSIGRFKVHKRPKIKN